VALGAALLLTGCAGQSGEALDADAVTACERFAPVAAEVERGNLSGRPLYRALQDVYNVGRTSETDGFPERAQRLLTAAINNDDDALGEQLVAMRETCRLPG
jgi:hypothetical protein